MWVFPLAAAAVAAGFGGLLGRDFVRRRRPYLGIWSVAMLMYAAASFMVFLGAMSGWTTGEFRVYWLLGAVLNVPLLAHGELELLVRNRSVRIAIALVIIFVTAYAFARVRTAPVHTGALAKDLPSGKEVFGDGTDAHRLPQLISIPSYLILLSGCAWSAWRMRGRADLRDRFVGTLGIAAGATVIAVVGSAAAAAGNLALFSLALLVGAAVMFAGFIRASRRPTPVHLSVR